MRIESMSVAQLNLLERRIAAARTGLEMREREAYKIVQDARKHGIDLGPIVFKGTKRKYKKRAKQ